QRALRSLAERLPALVQALLKVALHAGQELSAAGSGQGCGLHRKGPRFGMLRTTRVAIHGVARSREGQHAFTSGGRRGVKAVPRPPWDARAAPPGAKRLPPAESACSVCLPIRK